MNKTIDRIDYFAIRILQTLLSGEPNKPDIDHIHRAYGIAYLMQATRIMTERE